MTAHAKLMSPSSAARRIACAGSYALEFGLPDNASEASDDGTAIHTVSAWCLTSDRDAHAFVGRYIDVHDKGEPMRRVLFDHDKAELAQTYIDQIRAAAVGGELMVEQKVDFSSFVDMPGQFGTLDAAIYFADRKHLDVRDLKSGFHRVEVVASPQLMLYALGELAKRTMLGDEVETVTLGIHQPKVSPEPSEWTCSVDDLMAFAETARRATKMCEAGKLAHNGVAKDMQGASFADTYLRPGPEQCRFCKAAGTCPALRGVAARVVTFNPTMNSAVLDDFDVVGAPAAIAEVDMSTAILPACTPDQLGRLLQAAPMVEIWLKAVRAEGDRRLLAGQVVPGFKVVAGKKGARKWADPEAAEATLKGMRLKVEEMFDLSIISPTTAEKLTKPGEDGKPVLGPRQWQKLQALIVQNPGSPSVVPASDKRPTLAIAPPADDFEVVNTEPQGAEALA